MTNFKQRIPHIHLVAQNKRTSIEVIDPNDSTRHWHRVGNLRTSTDPFGAGHTHQFEGKTTSGPMPQ